MLAAMAMALQALIPQGFMPGGAGRPLSVVICTGHGPLSAALDIGQAKAPAPKGKSAGVCAFASHGASTGPTPGPSALAEPWRAPQTAAFPPPARVFVARDLAAPPPARGPPASLPETA